ncbi:hypothetical protein DL768_000488 [Monosporascus sp. mg162]|nr:hypothetical protein DL768_000488 [Monosporascus sp. mg162]
MRSFALTSLTLAGSLAAVASASSLPPWIARRQGEVSPDNTCGVTGAGTNGYVCPPELSCCSQHGYCGSTAAYCGTGCQSEFGTCEEGSGGDGAGDGDGAGSEGRCGPDFGSASCPENECCSAAGYCGSTADHCRAPDCLFQFGPACDANRVPGGTNTSSITRGALGRVLVGGGGIYPCNSPGAVALTYDDGPGDFTAEMLDLLAEYDAKVTFFITGVNNNKGQIDDPSTPWPAVIRRMHADGHQIASHTWSHADLSAITSAQRKDEMYKLEMAVRNILGLVPTYMRPPYSSCTADSGCQADMAELQYHIVYFDLDTTDYLNTAPDQIQNAIDVFDAFFADRSPETDDALAIAHDIHEQTATTLTQHMLQSLREMGYRMVTVGECLGDPVENWYRRADGAAAEDSSSSSSSSVASSTSSATGSATSSTSAPTFSAPTSSVTSSAGNPDTATPSTQPPTGTSSDTASTTSDTAPTSSDTTPTPSDTAPTTSLTEVPVGKCSKKRRA